jgi:2',3'-cyclic-nucleotide 2'-phosphodiesterase (5'-nucleotidase family)
VPGKISLLAIALLLAACLGCAGSPGAPPPPPAPPAEARLTVLQTTDLHHHASGAGHVAGGPGAVGSYARIAAYVEQVRASAGNPVLLVDSGDWSMGTVYDLALGSRPPALLFADALRYDCITLGNHEFDYGPAGLAGILRAAQRSFGLRTPIVASNLELGGNADLAPFLAPGGAIRRTRVTTLANGLRVGFLGLMGRDAAGSAPLAAPVRFADYGRDYGLVQALVDELRTGRHCQIVIALDHAGTDASGAGGEDVDLARNVTGIDLIASGHMHNPLHRALAVANGDWRTLIVCAGAFGTNVARVDLVWRDGRVSLAGSDNVAMTAAGLGPALAPDPAFALLVGQCDLELNRALSGLFAQLPGFGASDPADPARGLYRPVATCASDLRGNERSPADGPNGLGDLCADALRAVPNALLAKAPPGSDATWFQAALVGTGELRGALEAGRPITFADVYGILPLGRSPDPAQAGATGEPLISAYLEPDALRELCAMQLLDQTGLYGDFYIHLSGLACQLEPEAAAAFFAAAGAAQVMALARQRALAGSALARAALAALAGLPADQGAALLALAPGNPYAGALVRLGGPGGDPPPDPGASAGNLAVLGRVAAAAGRDAAAGSTELDTLLMAQAMAAIGQVRGFAPTDPACTGPTAALGPGRCRIALDLYALLIISSAQGRFGAHTRIFQAARGDQALSPDSPGGRAAILANRINLDPGGPMRELKAWQALLLYLATPPGRGGHFRAGRIGAEYDSSADLGRFPAFGAAVRTRNAGYPVRRVGALLAVLETLRHAP